MKLHTKNPGIKEAIEELMTVNVSTIWRARHEAKMNLPKEIFEEKYQKWLKDRMRAKYTGGQNLQGVLLFLIHNNNTVHKESALLL